MIKKRHIWITIIATAICLGVIVANIKFYSIENKTIDKETGQKITYTRKKQLEKLLQENTDIFENVVLNLRKLDNISALKQISIPFDAERENIRFYGELDVEPLANNQELLTALETLVQKLQINTVYIEPAHIGMLSGKKTEDDVCIIFTQTDRLNNTYQGIAYVVCGDETLVQATGSSHYYLLTQNNGTIAFLSKFDAINSTKWFYRCSRDLDWQTYTFWYRLYDVLHGNLK